MLRLNAQPHLDQSIPKPKCRRCHLAYSATTTERTMYVYRVAQCAHNYSHLLTLGEQLVALVSHAIPEVSEEDNTDTNHQPKKPAQAKLKIRAIVRSQAEMRSQAEKMSAQLTNAARTGDFVVQPSWAKVFLPSLMHQFFVSKQPFQDFVNHSAAFVANAQDAFNATHPNIAYRVAAGDHIVVTVSSGCILGPRRLTCPT